jgi:hypothetical protein
LRGNDAITGVYNPTINFCGGVGINYLFKINMALNARLLFDKKGAAGNENLYSGPDVSSSDGQVRFAFRSSYITLPIQYKYRLGKKIQYEFGLGVYGAYLVSNYLIAKATGSSTYSGSRENNLKSLKPYDLGLSSGFGVLIPLQESLALNIGINDNLGLTNTIKNPVKSNWAIRNNSLTMLLGVNYKFKND